jgi:hypothetical protein
MPLRFEDGTVYFEESCAVEDALLLAEHLRVHPETRACLRRCTYLHTSLMQVLLAKQVKCTSLPEEPFMARWLTPLLERSQSSQPQAVVLQFPEAPAAAHEE